MQPLTADRTEEMRERLTTVTGDSLADCALSVSEYGFRGQDMTFMSEALAQQGNTVERYLVEMAV